MHLSYLIYSSCSHSLSPYSSYHYPCYNYHHLHDRLHSSIVSHFVCLCCFLMIGTSWTELGLSSLNFTVGCLSWLTVAVQSFIYSNYGLMTNVMIDGFAIYCSFRICLSLVLLKTSLIRSCHGHLVPSHQCISECLINHDHSIRSILFFHCLDFILVVSYYIWT